jgi:hypothetical protein
MIIKRAKDNNFSENSVKLCLLSLQISYEQLVSTSNWVLGGPPT